MQAEMKSRCPSIEDMVSIEDMFSVLVAVVVAARPENAAIDVVRHA